MSKKHICPDRQGFLNRVEDIKHMESDVDKLLEAARLQRIESGRKPSVTPIMRIFAMLCIVAVMCVIFALIHDKKGAEFIYLLVGVGGIGAICAALFLGHE